MIVCLTNLPFFILLSLSAVAPMNLTHQRRQTPRHPLNYIRYVF